MIRPPGKFKKLFDPLEVGSFQLEKGDRALEHRSIEVWLISDPRRQACDFRNGSVDSGNVNPKRLGIYQSVT
jgi:hypothetical protein